MALILSQPAAPLANDGTDDETCGAAREAARGCYGGVFDGIQAWICGDALDDAIAAAGPVCDWGSDLGDTSADLEAMGTQRDQVTASSSLTDLTERQVVAAAAQLGFDDAPPTAPGLRLGRLQLRVDRGLRGRHRGRRRLRRRHDRHRGRGLGRRSPRPPLMPSRLAPSVRA